MNDGTPLVYLKCCRVWPLDQATGHGYCGVCGEWPQLLATDDEVREYRREMGLAPNYDGDYLAWWAKEMADDPWYGEDGYPADDEEEYYGR